MSWFIFKLAALICMIILEAWNIHCYIREIKPTLAEALNCVIVGACIIRMLVIL